MNPVRDMQRWLDALAQVPTGATTESDFLAWVDGPLKKFFPFTKFFCGYGRLTAASIEILRHSTIRYEPEFLAQLEHVSNQVSRGMFNNWLQDQKPFLLDADTPHANASLREIAEGKRFGLGLLAGHGVADFLSMSGTYFSFAGIPRRSDDVVLKALTIITPTLHAFFMRTIGPNPDKMKDRRLSRRQRDVVMMLADGMDDKAIAAKLGISQETVGNHVRAIYDRFGIHKRSELIAFLR